MAETGSLEIVLEGVAPEPVGNADLHALTGWRADRCVVVDADGGWVADCGSDVAPLIAASPDLLVALESFAGVWESGRSFAAMDVDEVERIRERARAAIRKARGQ